MKFNNELAVTLLKLIDDFPAESFLQPTIPSDPTWWHQWIPQSLEGISADRVLEHLYILSHSNLICPQLGLDEIRRLIEVSQLSDISNSRVVCGILKSILRTHTLTTQGYDYLQNHG